MCRPSSWSTGLRGIRWKRPRRASWRRGSTRRRSRPTCVRSSSARRSGRWPSRCRSRSPPPTASSRRSRSRSGTARHRGRAGRRTGRRPMPELTYLQAISDGLREEMRADERVFCLGEDIGAFGGAFKVTDGFIEEFGPDRVWDTPLAESAIVGTAVGAAVEGLRPVCEMQFPDFISCGFEQLVNVAAKMHYRQGLAGPVSLRLPSGGRVSGGAVPSQKPPARFLPSAGPYG